MTLCSLCGLEYVPGGESCKDRGCPMATSSCKTLHCPRCGYTAPDETTSVLARFARRLFGGGHEEVAVPPVGISLADLTPGSSAVITGLTGDPARLSRLTALGLTPGAPVRLVQRRPSLVVEVGETTLAVERRVAEGVGVRPA